MAGLLLFGKLVLPCIEKLGFVKYQNCLIYHDRARRICLPRLPGALPVSVWGSPALLNRSRIPQKIRHLNLKMLKYYFSI